MSKQHHIAALSALLAVALLSGCGSSKKEGGILPVSGTDKLAESQNCISCHSGNKFDPKTGVSITAEWLKSAHNLKNGASCPDCHTNTGHPAGGTIVKSVLDTQCATCHTTTLLNVPHFAAYTTSLAAQYVSQNVAAGGQCRTCHNPHDTTTLMQYNKDWADSGHGSTKYVPGNASASSVNSHYAWTTASRDACAKCHTTSGYLRVTNGVVGVLTAPGATSPTITGGPVLSTNTKNETIMCTACHNDYGWTRRAIGAQTLEYQYNAALITLPDAGDSNLCITCHAGRGNTQSARPTRNGSTYHHFVAAGTLYAAQTHTGYEFAGQDYTKDVLQHDTIGGSGSGPCVSCHMKNTSSHKYEVVSKNAAGKITALNSSATCADCHTGGSPMTVARLNAASDGYQEAGQLLSMLLTGNGIVIPASGTTAYIAGLSANNYGAWQNSFLPSDEPGGYAHNSRYVKRLLFDSIDVQQHGAFTGSISFGTYFSTNLYTTYPKAAEWFNVNPITKLASRP